MSDIVLKILFHLPIALTIVFTILSQLLVKIHFDGAGITLSGEKIGFLFRSFLEPKIISAIFFTFLAGMSWMIAMSRFSLSYAFPFLAINFGAMMVIDWYFFGRAIGPSALVGNILIVAGLLVIARGGQ